MDCKKCDNTVSYLIYESALARAERTIKRLWITCMVLIALIVVTNVMWIWHNNQFEDISTPISSEAVADNGGNAWSVINEHMMALKIVNLKAYNSIIQKLQG